MEMTLGMWGKAGFLRNLRQSEAGLGPFPVLL